MNRAPTVPEAIDSSIGQRTLLGITTLGLLAPFGVLIQIALMQKDGYSHGARLFEGTKMEIPQTLEIEVAIVAFLAVLGIFAAHYRR